MDFAWANPYDVGLIFKYTKRSKSDFSYSYWHFSEKTNKFNNKKSINNNKQQLMLQGGHRP